MARFFNHPPIIMNLNRCRFEDSITTNQDQTQKHPHQMKTQIKPGALALILVLTLNVPWSSCFAQGSLIPPGAPAPTMKSLAQIEPRAAITNTGAVTLSKPGSYYLTTNISVAGGAATNAITIAANNVTLDLNGFGITSTSSTPAGAGIMITGSPTNITILNGFISSGVTETGGTYSGHGFDSGINMLIDASNTNTFGQPINVRVSGVSIYGCMTYGIFLGGFSGTVDSCFVRTAGSYGIYASIVRNSEAVDCGSVGISGDEVLNCEGQCIAGGGWGIYAGYVAQNCYGVAPGGDGIHAQQLAQNCYGNSSASGYQGIYTDVAENCWGYNTGGAGLRATSSAINCHGLGTTAGLEADGMAQNCYGRASTNGIGLIATSANNCYGYCPAGSTGTGLSATLANNCYGQDDGDGVALSAGVAIGCEGRAYGNNFAISASILNSCIYYRNTGTPATQGTKYNMP